MALTLLVLHLLEQLGFVETGRNHVFPNVLSLCFTLHLVLNEPGLFGGRHLEVRLFVSLALVLDIMFSVGRHRRPPKVT